MNLTFIKRWNFRKIVNYGILASLIYLLFFNDSYWANLDGIQLQKDLQMVFGFSVGRVIYEFLKFAYNDATSENGERTKV